MLQTICYGSQMFPESTKIKLFYYSGPGGKRRKSDEEIKKEA